LCIDDGAGALTTAGGTPGGISLLMFGP
jgi:hypothetical protein